MFYIKVENNQPLNFPTPIENLKTLHPDFNSVNNYGFIPFIKSALPLIDNPYLIIETQYIIKDGQCFELHKVRLMTEEEKNNKIASLVNQKPYDSWIFNNELCKWEPPIPMPDGKYYWDEDTTTWVPES